VGGGEMHGWRDPRPEAPDVATKPERAEHVTVLDVFLEIVRRFVEEINRAVTLMAVLRYPQQHFSLLDIN
jgi:hypothetical protein